MSSKTSCMPSFKIVATLYGENGGMLMSGISLWIDFYMTWKDQVFITNVVVIDPMWETVASSVISQLAGIIAELNAIIQICKYRRLNERHHFISMAMEVHHAPGRDIDHFIKECAHLFHDRKSKGHLSLSFCIQFFKQCVSISFQHVLAFIIGRKIPLEGDACFRPPITIKFHNLHVNHIKGVVGEITTYHERDYLSPFCCFMQVIYLLAFPFLSPLWWF